MTTRSALSFSATVVGSFAYVRSALRPAILGTLIFAFVSFLGDYIRALSILGDFGYLVSFCMLSSLGISWLAMAIREGVGAPNPGIGLEAGRQEMMLGASLIGFLFVIGIITFLVGFLAFLLVMMIAAIGGGAFTGADVASAPIFETPEAFRAFLSQTDMGRTVAMLGIGVIVAAGLFMFWLILRLSPFAAGAISQKRFIVLQAMSWTRYTDWPLLVSGLIVVGGALLAITAGRWGATFLPLPALAQSFIAHLLTCFCLLFIIGFICQLYRQLVIEKSGAF